PRLWSCRCGAAIHAVAPVEQSSGESGGRTKSSEYAWSGPRVRALPEQLGRRTSGSENLLMGSFEVSQAGTVPSQAASLSTLQGSRDNPEPTLKKPADQVAHHPGK
ncbi:MAG: hypothetical protein LC729_01185, partial [Acidobacteria bacterium]|nr:hypothetical protein [Acidobacteriota bacterium]